MNEPLGNLPSLHSTLHQKRLFSSCCWLASGLPVHILEEVWLWRVISRKGGSYAFKASLLFLAFMKAPTLSLKKDSKSVFAGCVLTLMNKEKSSQGQRKLVSSFLRPVQMRHLVVLIYAILMLAVRLCTY